MLIWASLKALKSIAILDNAGVSPRPSQSENLGRKVAAHPAEPAPHTHTTETLLRDVPWRLTRIACRNKLLPDNHAGSHSGDKSSRRRDLSDSTRLANQRLRGGHTSCFNRPREPSPAEGARLIVQG